MQKLSMFIFAAALIAFGFAGQASAAPESTPGWGWGEGCDNKTLSVENETLDQSVAETGQPQPPKPEKED